MLVRRANGLFALPPASLNWLELVVFSRRWKSCQKAGVLKTGLGYDRSRANSRSLISSSISSRGLRRGEYVFPAPLEPKIESPPTGPRVSIGRTVVRSTYSMRSESWTPGLVFGAGAIVGCTRLQRDRYCVGGTV